jgi:DNA-directed RNA polymerase specialized sigma24 family protein
VSLDATLRSQLLETLVGQEDMAIKLDDYLAKLPETEQQAITTRARVLIEQEASLRQLRDAQERSKEEIAKRLGVDQTAVSKREE